VPRPQALPRDRPRPGAEHLVGQGRTTGPAPARSAPRTSRRPAASSTHDARSSTRSRGPTVPRPAAA